MGILGSLFRIPNYIQLLKQLSLLPNRFPIPYWLDWLEQALKPSSNLPTPLELALKPNLFKYIIPRNPLEPSSCWWSGLPQPTPEHVQEPLKRTVPRNAVENFNFIEL